MGAVRIARRLSHSRPRAPAGAGAGPELAVGYRAFVTRPEPPQPSTPTPPPPDNSSQFSVEGLLRVTRAFLVPFLLSWALCYVGGEWRNDWMYYTGLAGVGLSIVGLLLWLLHH